MKNLALKDYRESHLGKKKAQQYHSKFSENPYRAMLWAREKEIISSILSAVKFDTQIKHLDFACGTGRITSHLKDFVNKSTGLDISEDMLEIARAQDEDIEYILGDLTNNNMLEGKQFELITAFRFFPNAQPELRDNVLKELVPMLAKNGVFLVNNHKYKNSIVYFVARIFRLKRSGVSNAELVELFSSHGLSVAERRYSSVFPVTENYIFLPVSFIDKVDRFLSKIPIINRLGSNHIYVLKRSIDI